MELYTIMSRGSHALSLIVATTAFPTAADYTCTSDAWHSGRAQTWLVVVALMKGHLSLHILE
jgi:hypothetical protein